MGTTKKELQDAHNNEMVVMENHLMRISGCDRKTANLMANEVLDIDRDAERILSENEVQDDGK